MTKHCHEKTKWESKSPGDWSTRLMVVLTLLWVPVFALSVWLSSVWFSWISALLLTAVGVTIMFTLVGIIGTSAAWYIRSMAWLTGSRAVEYVDFQGAHGYTIVYKNQDSLHRWRAPVDWFTQVGEILLLADGTVDKSSHSCYIHYWIPLSPQDRLIHVLTYGPREEFQ